MSRLYLGSLERRLGEVVGDRFELLELIGAGRQGTVFRARDRANDVDVAAKLLQLRCDDQVGRERLAREVRALETLGADGVARVVASTLGPTGELWLVTELLVGETLAQAIDRCELEHRPFGEAQLLFVVQQVAATLDRAHGHGFVHRDVKPSNIFLADDGSVRLLDFGYVRILDAIAVTADDVVPGSPAYVAPEATYTSELDARADVYALGVLTFRALTGQFPFEAPTALGILDLALHAPRPSLHALRPDLPPEVDAFVERALAASPQDRFATAGALAEALSYVLALDGTSG